MIRYAAPAVAAVAGAAVVALLLALLGWPGPSAWHVVHVAVGGGLVGAWTWTQAHGVEPTALVVAWWPPLMGGALVVAPALAMGGGGLARGAAVIAVGVAVLSVWVARDCVDRLEQAEERVQRRRDAHPTPDAVQRLERAEASITERISLIESQAPEAAREVLRRHRAKREGAHV